MGQPLRRRHDRADRLLLRLLRDGSLRRAADAGHGFPLSAVLPDERPRIAQVDIRAAERSAGARRSTWACRRRSADARARCMPRLKAKSDRRASGRGDRRTTQRAQGPRRARRPAGRARPHASAARRARRSASRRRTTRSSPADVGMPIVWAARYLAMNGKRRLIGSFWHGSMANAMPQAIGAQAALPGRQVISLSGDGGFAMLMGDLLEPRPARAAGEGRSCSTTARSDSSSWSRNRPASCRSGTDLVNPNFARWRRRSVSRVSASSTQRMSRRASPKRSPIPGPCVDAVWRQRARHAARCHRSRWRRALRSI